MEVVKTKEEKKKEEAYRVAVIAKQLASNFWRKNHPIKKGK